MTVFAGSDSQLNVTSAGESPPLALICQWNPELVHKSPPGFIVTGILHVACRPGRPCMPDIQPPFSYLWSSLVISFHIMHLQLELLR